ncbi:uncharacterized protein BYT42DRAFT_309042 [Radiomyces spectabilis]|uniref:uncharacterized protein n=1 Tax=Radiomyces spectabilis TaxID=64574 RepID=UPI002220358C|nr:uncharacterized protein BYT42DRAFT_309042 [Radiomyces spectabilis]KAI8381547.1 hypothetical protein BYT42DRAFT_309042 [Radiomyces spectabilis]
MSETNETMRIALVMGATGAVGKAVLKDLLLNSTYAKVVIVGRRAAELSNDIPQEKLVQKTVDFENLEQHREAFRGVNDVYCCLGTTRADAGGAAQFKKIDQGYVVNSAKIIAEENPAKTQGETVSPIHFLYCSSASANKNSLFLYIQTKGETEDRLSNLGFQRVSIFRPGLLELEEPRSRPRFAETIFATIFSPINRTLGLHMAAQVGAVARAMRKVANDDPKLQGLIDKKKATSESGSQVTIYSNKDIDMLNE